MSSPSHNNNLSRLSLRGISKKFGREHVLHNLDLEVQGGMLTLLLGQNGSGKSTLLRIAAELTRADRGTVESSTRGFLGHQSFLYGSLSVRENVELAAKLKRVSPDMDSYLASWELTDIADKSVHALSKGQHAKAALARVFLDSPKVLLLDEPTSSLDEAATNLLIKKLEALRGEQSSAILVATHDVARLESHAQRAIVLSKGAVAADSASGGLSLRSVVEQYRGLNR